MEAAEGEAECQEASCSSEFVLESPARSVSSQLSLTGGFKDIY